VFAITVIISVEAKNDTHTQRTKTENHWQHVLSRLMSPSHFSDDDGIIAKNSKKYPGSIRKY
jgi:hypothetical protein